MIVFLIPLCVLQLGKIVGQQPILQTVSAPSLFLTPPAPPSEFSGQLQPPSQFEKSESIISINPFTRDNGRAAIIQPEVDGRDQARRHLFIPQRPAEITSRPYRPVARAGSEGTDVNNHRTLQESDGREDVIFVGETMSTSDAPREVFRQAPVKSSQAEDEAGRKPESSTDQPKVPQVTLDQRASFDGDKCPRGFIRVNGSNQCVEID